MCRTVRPPISSVYFQLLLGMAESSPTYTYGIADHYFFIHTKSLGIWGSLYSKYGDTLFYARPFAGFFIYLAHSEWDRFPLHITNPSVIFHTIFMILVVS